MGDIHERFIEKMERVEKIENQDNNNKSNNKQSYFNFAKVFMEEMLEISKRKNSDYTGDTDDPFSNFSSVESLGIKTEVGFIVRMNDKMKRLASFVEKGTLEVKDESVKDTLQDLANYCILFAGYLESKK